MNFIVKYLLLLTAKSHKHIQYNKKNKWLYLMK
jgi:hypothetical protein